MYELSLGDGKGEAPGCRDTAERAVLALEELNVAPVGGGRDGDHEIVHVGDYNTLRYHWVQWRDMYNKEEGGDGGALGGAHGDRRKYSWRTLEEKSTPAVGKKTANPCCEVFVGPFGPQCRRELAGVDIVEAALDV